MKSYVLEVWARLCPHISPWSRPADQLNAIPEKRLKRLAFNPFTHKHDSARSPSIGQGSPSHTHTHTLESLFFLGDPSELLSVSFSLHFYSYCYSSFHFVFACASGRKIYI